MPHPSLHTASLDANQRLENAILAREHMIQFNLASAVLSQIHALMGLEYGAGAAEKPRRRVFELLPTRVSHTGTKLESILSMNATQWRPSIRKATALRGR